MKPSLIIIFLLLSTSIIFAQKKTFIEDQLFDFPYFSNVDYLMNKDKVQYLDFQLNGSSILPADLLQLPHLKLLYISTTYYKPDIDSLIEQIKNIHGLIGLGLSSCNIDSIPASISKMKNLKYLDLSSNDIVYFPNEIRELKNLEFLNLSYCPYIPEQIYDLVSLKTLNLCNVDMDELSEHTTKLQNLRNIYLSNNNKLDFYKGFQLLAKIPDLNEIYMFGTVGSLPENIGELKNIKVLKCNGCSIDSLPASIVNCKKLEVLDLSSNDISDITQIIDIASQLPNLQMIDFSWDEIDSIPKNIGKMKNVRELKFFYSFIKTMSDEIGNLSNIETLDFTGCEFKSLPNSFSNLNNLKSLNLSACYNLDFNNTLNLLSSLTKLQVLILYNDSLECFPVELLKFSKLKDLSLNENYMKELPDQISLLKNLNYLDVGSNDLKTLPNSISNLKNLKTLDISRNEFKKVPRSILDLKIKNLYLGGNDSIKPKDLFSDLINMKYLDYVNLEHQEIREYPENIEKMKRLKTLQLGYVSCCSYMPEEVLNKIITALPHTQVKYEGPKSIYVDTVEYTKNTSPEEKEDSLPQPFIVVEEMPSFPGGDEARITFITENLHFPNIQKDFNLQGTIYVTFVVEPDGTLSNIKLLRGIGKEFDEEAIRVIKMMPKWNPGKQSGKNVRVQFNIPIRVNYR